jgi:hypothetical protein
MWQTNRHGAHELHLQYMKQAAENDILQAICEFLWYNKIFFYRNNNTPTYDAARRAYRAMPKWGMKGISDIVGVFRGRPMYIECKVKGKYASKEQKEFIQKILDEGGIAGVCRSIDDVKKLLNI